MEIVREIKGHVDWKHIQGIPDDDWIEFINFAKIPIELRDQMQCWINLGKIRAEIDKESICLQNVYLVKFNYDPEHIRYYKRDYLENNNMILLTQFEDDWAYKFIGKETCWESTVDKDKEIINIEAAWAKTLVDNRMHKGFIPCPEEELLDGKCNWARCFNPAELDNGKCHVKYMFDYDIRVDTFITYNLFENEKGERDEHIGVTMMAMDCKGKKHKTLLYALRGDNEPEPPFSYFEVGLHFSSFGLERED